MEMRSYQPTGEPVNIILTGFMGTGKTAAGKILARRTGREFVDTDKEIASRAGKSIADIFFQDGESAFRDYEREIARALSKENNLVISTGGGLMLDPLNALLLSQRSLIFCLTATAEEILARTSDDFPIRPLLEVENPAQRIEKLLLKRKAAYDQFTQIHTGGRSIQQVAGELLDMSSRLISEGAWQTLLASQIPIQHPSGTYDVLVGRGLLAKTANGLSTGSPIVVVSDTNVSQFYVNSYENLGRFEAIITPAGEEYKNLRTVQGIYDRLLEAGMDRSGTIVAVGGGVVGDMAGFAAATFMRGVKLIQCPTSLLAMVDSSVGGKTGVDLPQGKNLVGAFKQPESVVADLDTLRTLPGQELLGGLAEVVKAAIIASPSLFQSLESLAPQLFAAAQGSRELPLADIQILVVESVLIKRDIVESDPFEEGRRKLLNLGHTFAHAVEQSSGYAVRHGQAVSIGLVAAARLSSFLDLCPGELPDRIETLLRSLSLPTRIPLGISTKQIIDSMRADKKVQSGEMRFILIRSLGDVFVDEDVPLPALRKVLDELQN